MSWPILSPRKVDTSDFNPFSNNFYVALFLDSAHVDGSVVECLTPDRGVAGSSLNGGAALCP